MILERFFDFYLERISPELRQQLLALLTPEKAQSSGELAGMFRRDDPEALEFLLNFHLRMADIRCQEPEYCIMFDDPQNICFPFFIGYVLEHLPESIQKQAYEHFGTSRMEAIVEQLTKSADARNWFRENISCSLEQEHLFALSEVIALINFSSGGEYSFLNLVYPGIKEMTGLVLDAGCGMGFSSLIMSRYTDVVAVDACLSRLHRARGLAVKMADSDSEVRRLLNLIKTEMGEMNREKAGVHIEEVLQRPQGEIRFLNASLDKLPLEGPLFNGIVCLDVLEHTFDPDAVVREFSRLAKPGALVWITVPNANGEYYQSLEENSRGATFPAMLHLHHWEIEELNHLFGKNGFEPVTVRPFDLLPSADVTRVKAGHPHRGDWPDSNDEKVFLQLFAVYRRV